MHHVESSRRARLTSVLAFASALVVALTIVFVPILNESGYLFSNADALLFFVSFEASRRVGSPLDLQSFGFDQGFGSFLSPTTLDPFWWTFAATGSAQAAYLLAATLTFAGVLAYARALRMNVLPAIIGAAATCCVFFNPALTLDYFATIMPQFIMQTGLAYLAMGIALRATRESPAMMLPAFAAFLCSVMVDWLYVVFLAGFLAVTLPALIGNAWGSERRLSSLLWLGGALAGAGLFAYWSGVYDAFASAGLLAERLWNPTYPPLNTIEPDINPYSLSFWGGLTGMRGTQVLGFAGVAAAFHQLVVGGREIRLVAAGVLVLVAMLAAIEMSSTGTNVYWLLPALGYFERPLFPLYVIFVVSSLVHLLGAVRPASGYAPFRTVSDAWGRSAAWGTGLAFVVGACGALAISVWWVKRDGDAWTEPLTRLPYYWERTARFAKELSLAPTIASGSIAYFLDATEGAINDCPHLRDDSVVGRKFYCTYMLVRAGVANFSEFKNHPDIQTAPMERQAILTARKLSQSQGDAEASAARSLGLRYVALDGRVNRPGRHLNLGGREVSIVDLGTPTAADVSVQSVRLAERYSADEVVTARRERIAIVDQRAEANRIGPLAPVDRFRLEPSRGGLKVQAETSGASILLLPFRFSHCLRLAADGDARLIRVNGAQAALHFRGHTTGVIRNAFTLFGDSRCRLGDFADAMRSGLWPVQAYEEIAKGRRVPWLMQLYLKSRLRQRDRILAAP